MASDEKQRLAFEYLVGKFHDQQVFEKADFQKATAWTDSTFDTYWTKQFRQFFVQVGSGRTRKLRVGESFRPYLSWERFQKHVIRREPPLSVETFEEAVIDAESPEADTLEEATKIRWAFGVLFVQSIVQVVNGEAQIWMMESGMRSRLHIWLVESAAA